MQELNCPNIRFGTFKMDIKEDGSRMDSFTSILLISNEVSEEEIRAYAKTLISRGCRDFAFCGLNANKWHTIFDEVDISITKSKEDYATTWSIETLDEVPDSLCICKENVFIYCSDYELVRKCHSVIVGAGYGFKVRLVGEIDSIAFPKDKVFTVLSIEKGWYRIMSELDEDYLLPPEACVQV